MLSFNDSYQEWAGDIYFSGEPSGCEPGEGGLILKNLRHQNYNFARDVRILGMWIEFETTESAGITKTERKFYAINTINFTFNCIEQWKESDLNPPSVPSPNADRQTFLDILKKFNYYRYIFGIRSKYISKPGMLPSNCDIGEVIIDHGILFSKYSNSPSHEPTGNLQAARFYPTVTTKFNVNAQYSAVKFPSYKVKKVRVDHRIHLSLDSLTGDKPSPATSFPSSANNYAGVFKDRESFSKSGAIYGGAAKAVFEAVEKPLLFEIAAKGYENSNHINQSNVKLWDNIHWWGQRFDGGTATKKADKHISTPGGFFAAHFHWRWGKAARDQAQKDAQYTGSPGNDYLLIDPSISPQTLTFAVVKNIANLNPDTKGIKPEDLSKEDFASLFKSAGGSAPTDISGGENIVVFLSIEISPNPNSAAGNTFSGTQLLQGIFFAHNQEPGFFSKAGTKSSLYFPNSEKDIRTKPAWERY